MPTIQFIHLEMVTMVLYYVYFTIIEKMGARPVSTEPARVLSYRRSRQAPALGLLTLTLQTMPVNLINWIPLLAAW